MHFLKIYVITCEEEIFERPESMDEKINEPKKQNTLLKQAKLGKDSLKVIWEYEPTDDAKHRLNLIFKILLSNELP